MIEHGQTHSDLENVQQFLAAHQWDQAISLLEPIVQKRPYDCQALSKLGFATWKKGDRQKGAHILEKALELDPDDPEVVKDCVRIFLEAGRGDDARQILESYVQRNPWELEVKQFLDQLSNHNAWNGAPRQESDKEGTAADLLVHLGEEEYDKGNVARARMCFEMAMEKEPAHAKAYNNMGVLTWQEGDLERAMTYFEKALDLAPTDGEILLNAAKVLEAAGHYETGSQLLEIYLTAYPQDAEVWSDYREMIRRGAQSWSPENLDGSVAEIYEEMGRRLAQAGDVQGAAEAFARVARLQPNNAQAYYQLGLLHLNLNQLQEALEMLQEAQSLDSQNNDVAEALAKVRQMLEGVS
ncbi:tetratricopeptide repeat protein [Desulfosoma sp.]|uniref:tetratricopeptide repeat protein n=1 Tax=Desulfosoma sp. TaxID=2603217 RepID=UPI00404B72EB